MNIDDFIVSEDISLVEIMKRLDMTKKGIVYVCNEDRVLLGSITDGDIRRLILKNGWQDFTASEVMETNPITLTELEKNNSERIMKEYEVRSVPIIDARRRIVSISFSFENESVSVKKKIDAPVVIMAGGKGARLRPYTNILPKPLIPIGEKSITEHIIERFERAGCNRFSMIVNYKKNLIKAYFKDNEIKKNIDFIEENEFLGTSGGLRLLIGKYKETFFVSNCDILIESDYATIYDYHKKSGNIATVVGAVKNMVLPYGVISTEESGRIKKIKEKPDISSIVNTGLYVLEPEFLEEIPSDKVSQMTDVLQSCIDRGMCIGMYPVSEESWMDMGQLDELEKMRERMGDIE